MTDLVDLSALEERVQNLLTAARKAGADQADAVAIRSVSLSVDVREGRVEEGTRSENDDFGLRVFVGRRQAVVSTNDAVRLNPDRLAERAVAMARAAPEDPFAGLADPGRLAQSVPDLDLLDPTLPGATALEALARAAEEAALAVPGVTKSSGASASAGLGGFVLATSEGFRGAYVASQHSLSTTAIAGEGTAMEQDWEYSSARHAADLEDAAALGRKAAERAVRRLNPRKVATTRVPVIFDPRVANSLVGHIASAINGAAIARGTSFLLDKLGTAILPPGTRVIDDPLRRRGLGSRPFDGEGVAGAPLAVVEDGVLASWLLDSATARELGLATTGHAHRGTGGSPSPSPSNLYLAAGQASPRALIADIRDGFYITDLIGMGASIVTGDYSRGASGVWIENGELTYPVAEVTIAGNLADMFRALTPADDLEFRYSTNAPTLRVEGLTIAGR
ncbi:TldD/PmbA family protein [Blastochloris sulfoviridis]|uniref:TldD/PmbA family protein n=1 Tax=Blastochloris sulfoviridis TaxID=50712 RepID=A0A5M6HNL2_9HYPH|nr:TldD/PmbA family protein [Blastochloris sulfoviridis]KAA5597258.1 TldD/PmbA family protein [Blastochloris sulfoviridis]